jgi:hypothetical protein
VVGVAGVVGAVLFFIDNFQFTRVNCLSTPTSSILDNYFTLDRRTGSPVRRARDGKSKEWKGLVRARNDFLMWDCGAVALWSG